MATRVTRPATRNAPRSLCPAPSAAPSKRRKHSARPQPTGRPRCRLLRGSEMQPAILVNELFELGMLLLNRWLRRAGRFAAAAAALFFAPPPCALRRIACPPDSRNSGFPDTAEPALYFSTAPGPALYAASASRSSLYMPCRYFRYFTPASMFCCGSKLLLTPSIRAVDGHQLHQSLGAFGRNRVGIVIALHLDHGMHQQRIHVVRARA